MNETYKKKLLTALTVAALLPALAATQVFAAGAVTSSLKKGVLRLNGDINANSISIVPGNSGASFEVTPNAGTTLDGGAVPIIYTGVTRDVRIDLDEGDNTVVLTNLSINRNLFITTGGGADNVSLDNVVSGATTKIDLGNGDNILDVFDGFVKRGKIRGGQGIDTFMFDFSAGGTGFTGRIDAREGDDSITITNLGGQNTILVKGSHGNDTISLSNVTADKLVVNGGKNDDLVTIGSLTIGRKAIIQGAANTDTLVDNGGHSGVAAVIKGFEL